MARQLKLWVAALIGGMGLVALAFVPPRSAPDEGDVARWGMWFWATPERRRVEQLATAWHAVQRALLAARYRDAAKPWTALDSVWQSRGLTSEIPVGIAVVPDTLARLPSRPQAERFQSPIYLLPSAAGDRTCTILLAQRHAPRLPHPGLVLGPCAYYAAFGRPGRAIENWLRARRFDLAYEPAWLIDTPRRGPPGHRRFGDRPDWNLESFFANTGFQATACAGGRAAACRAEVLRATVTASDNDRAGIVATDFWWRRRSLLGAELFLSDLVTAEGPERFRRFWRSEQPVDEAFAAAFGEPIGEWTRRWQRGMLPEVPLGAPVHGGAVALGVLLAGVAVTMTLVLVGRRQVT